MPDRKQLPHLLKLLDDDSEFVRRAVVKELESYGTSLEEELAVVPGFETFMDNPVLQKMLERYDRQWLSKAWPVWMDLEDDAARLEAALSLIAEFMNGRSYPHKLDVLLDQLANDFDRTHARRDAFELANFLFKTRKIEGARDDYYNPLNSNLVYVIQEKRGIPISLACVYMLVGHRLGLPIEGCNFPGHFLARTWSGDKMILVDCYEGGRILDPTSVSGPTLQATQTLQIVMDKRIEATEIILRVLRNLTRAYEENHNKDCVRLMRELINFTQSRKPWNIEN